MIPASRIELVKDALLDDSWMIEGCPELGSEFIEMLQISSRQDLRQLTEADFINRFQAYPKDNLLLLFHNFINHDVFGLMGGAVKFAVLNPSIEDPWDFCEID
jgi:hypothetical protein